MIRLILLAATMFWCAPSLGSEQDSILQAWDSCLEKIAKQFAIKSNEPAETVVMAAFGVCTKEQKMYRQFVKATLGTEDAKAISELVQVFINDRRNELIAVVLINRMNRTE